MNGATRSGLTPFQRVCLATAAALAGAILAMAAPLPAGHAPAAHADVHGAGGAACGCARRSGRLTVTLNGDLARAGRA
jgi:hypothetical protein